MFREVAIAVLAITGVGIVLHALISRGPKTGLQHRAASCAWARLVRGGAAVVVLASVLGLATTGLYSRLVLDTALAGYLLIAHASLGGAFVAALAVFAVTWAWEHWEPPGRWVHKTVFWLMVIAAIPMVLAVLLNMFPVFGTEWQAYVVEIHRTCGLICTICGVIWGYLAVRRATI